jgi:hypothetical protein
MVGIVVPVPTGDPGVSREPEQSSGGGDGQAVTAAVAVRPSVPIIGISR